MVDQEAAYPKDAGQMVCYAIGQIVLGSAVGWFAGGAFQAGDAVTAALLVGTLAALQLADHAGAVSLPWNYHAPPPPKPDPKKKKYAPLPPPAYQAVPVLVRRNVFITLAVAMGFAAGLVTNAFFVDIISIRRRTTHY